MHYVFFLERQLFLVFSLFSFVCCNKWLDPQIPFGEVALLFICQEHSIFQSYRFNECSLFLELRLAFVFRLDMCSDLHICFHQGVFLPLVLIGFHQKSWL
jgi:hypothetical protein